MCAKRSREEILVERQNVISEIRAVGPPMPKGVSGNPHGRPRGSHTGRILMEAIKAVEEEEDVDILQYFIKRALSSDAVLINLLKKLVPDLKSVFVISEGGDKSTKEIEQKIVDVFRNAMSAKFEEPVEEVHSKADSES